MSGTGTVDQIRQLRGIIQNFNENQLRKLFHVLARIRGRLPAGLLQENIDRTGEEELRLYAEGLPSQRLLDQDVWETILFLQNRPNAGSQTTGPSATSSAPSTSTQPQLGQLEDEEEEELSEEERQTLERTKQMIEEIGSRHLINFLRKDIDDEQRKKINLKKGILGHIPKKDLIDFAKNLGTTLLEPRIQNRIQQYYRTRPWQLPGQMQQRNIQQPGEVGELSEEQRQERIEQTRQMIEGLGYYEFRDLFAQLTDQQREQLQMTKGDIYNTRKEVFMQRAKSFPDEWVLSLHDRIKEIIDRRSESQQQPNLAGIARGSGQQATEKRETASRQTATVTLGQQDQFKRRYQPILPKPGLPAIGSLAQPTEVQQKLTKKRPAQKKAAATGTPPQQDQTKRRYQPILPKPGQPATGSPAQPTEVQQKLTKKKPASGQTATVTHAQQDQTKCRHPQILQIPALGPPVTGFPLQQTQPAGALIQPVQRQTQQVQLPTTQALPNLVLCRQPEPTGQFASGFQSQQQPVPSGFISLPEGTQMLTWEEYLELLSTQNAPDNQNQGYQSADQPQATGQFVSGSQQYQSMPRLGFPSSMTQGVQQQHLTATAPPSASQLKGIILKFNKNQLRKFFHVLARVNRLPAGLREENIDSAQEGALKFYAGILSSYELSHPEVRRNIFLIQPDAGRQIQTTGPLATSTAPSTATAPSTERSASQSAGKQPRSVQQPKLAGVARGQPATGGRLIKKRKTAASGQHQQPATSTGTPETCRTPERKPTTRIDVATPSPPGQQQRPATPTGQSPVTGQPLLQPALQSLDQALDQTASGMSTYPTLQLSPSSAQRYDQQYSDVLNLIDSAFDIPDTVQGICIQPQMAGQQMPTGQAPGTGQPQLQQPDALQQAMAAAFGNQSSDQPQPTGQFVSEPQQYQSMPRIGFPDPMVQGVQQPQPQQQMPTGRAPDPFQQAMPRVLCEEDEETQDQGRQDPENQ